MNKLFIVVLVLLWAYGPSTGISGVPTSRPVDELYGRSDLVVEATVRSIDASCVTEKKGICNNNYALRIDVVKQYKARSKDQSTAISGLTLCSNSALEIGDTYFLFFEPANEFNDVGSNNCDLVVDYDGVFQTMADLTYRVGAPDMQTIVNFDGRKYMTNAIVVPGFEEQLDGLSHSSKGNRK
ncbi:hypothetical protein LVB77_01605 [Lysobacter sp. 5GHs7-4]|uniref:hypothetical protein n=1 Tax=Lysobacter sp. 5GHs7-4 TaxID=2904253 RepID=UPI001E54416F|nr:hypothetical protein [Lysobacter sp. 5GHs7-4]UHQ23436.1 hypothetical protein LVB77_01605 [Lysobacter sp. 5GHs7-4]